MRAEDFPARDRTAVNPAVKITTRGRQQVEIGRNVPVDFL
jgi:hypothetical protein